MTFWASFSRFKMGHQTKKSRKKHQYNERFDKDSPMQTEN